MNPPILPLKLGIGMNSIFPSITSRALASCTILQPARWADKSGSVVLTFDDGSNWADDGRSSLALLDVLRRQNVRATFCYIGSNVDRLPEVARQAFLDGHELANHTYHHSIAGLLRKRMAQDEIIATDRALARAIGVASFKAKFFRPPFGVITPAVADAVRQQERDYAYLSCFVDDSAATERTSKAAFEKIKHHLLSRRGGAVVVHEMRYLGEKAKNSTDKSWLPAAVEDLIIWGRGHGLRFETYDASR
jgi:peptidoglycan/xylan/chitin deacetylase (PgdA/CDA1 family)